MNEVKQAIFDEGENERIIQDILNHENFFNTQEDAIEFWREVANSYNDFISNDHETRHKIFNIHEPSEIFSPQKNVEMKDDSEDEALDDYIIQKQAFQEFGELHSQLSYDDNENYNEFRSFCPLCPNMLLNTQGFLVWESDNCINIDIKGIENFSLQDFVQDLYSKRKEHIKLKHFHNKNPKMNLEISQDDEYGLYWFTAHWTEWNEYFFTQV